jgi:uncharacterized protein YegL
MAKWEVEENKVTKVGTEILCIIDRSGSMAYEKEEAIEGFNKFLKDQIAVGEDASMSIVLFDDEYILLYDNKPITEIPYMDNTTFVPRGATALYDAIGKAVVSVGERGNDKCIVCVITDGMENQSKEYTKDMIDDLMKEYEDKGWQFIFLSSDLTAVEMAASMSFTSARAVKGVGGAYTAAVNFATSYRTGTPMPDADSTGHPVNLPDISLSAPLNFDGTSSVNSNTLQINAEDIRDVSNTIDLDEIEGKEIDNK